MIGIKGTKPKITIGILGCEPVSGVTHLSIALSTYLANRRGKKTALAEPGERDPLRGLSVMGGTGGFCMNHVSCYPLATGRELGQIMCREYDYVVLDLGSDNSWARTELLRCSVRIIVGSLCPWRRNIYHNYIETMKTVMGIADECMFLSLFGDRIENKKCRRTFGVRMNSIPFIADPFRTNTEENTFLQTLI